MEVNASSLTLLIQSLAGKTSYMDQLATNYKMYA